MTLAMLCSLRDDGNFGATGQETRGPTRQNHDSIADVQVDKPAAHERVRLAVLKRKGRAS
jgi:hypothetical protein